jgi:hypothetical protein
MDKRQSQEKAVYESLDNAVTSGYLPFLERSSAESIADDMRDYDDGVTELEHTFLVDCVRRWKTTHGFTEVTDARS